MSAFVVIRIEAKDPTKLQDYQKVAPAIIKKYKGKILARGGEVVSLEGSEENRRIVIIEFPSLNIAKEFYASKEYTDAIALRKNVAEFELIAIEGIS